MNEANRRLANKRWCEKNRERRLIYFKENYQKNREEKKAKALARYYRNKDRHLQVQKLYNQRNGKAKYLASLMGVSIAEAREQLKGV